MKNEEGKKMKLDEIMTILRGLHAQYGVSTTGRKELISKIKDCILSIKKETNIYNAELNELEDYYNYRDYYVSDYMLVMRVLLHLANSEEDVYELKKIYATDFVNIDNKTKQLYGKTMVIANKEALDNVNNDQIYYYNEFSELAKNIINNGYSMIIVTYNFFDGNVKPKINLVTDIEKIDINNSGMVGNISCYLYDDSLKKAVYRLKKHIDINGPDFTNIDENLLYKMICNNDLNEFVMKKKK